MEDAPNQILALTEDEGAHKQSGRLLREGGLSGLFQNGGGLSRTSVGFGLLESSSKWSFVSSWLSFSSPLAREEPSQPGTPTCLGCVEGVEGILGRVCVLCCAVVCVLCCAVMCCGVVCVREED